MEIGTFGADATAVELDTTRILSVAEISEYSIRHYIQNRLTAWNWNIDVKPMNDGWTGNEEIVPPAVVVELRSVDVAGVELGSHGSRLLVLVHIIGANDAQRIRLAELITKNVFRDTVPIYNFITGNETNPVATGEYFLTDDVGWSKLPTAYTAPDTRRWIAVVTANLRRVE